MPNPRHKVSVETVPIEAGVELRTGEAEQAGRPGLVAARLAQRLLDQGAIHRDEIDAARGKRSGEIDPDVEAAIKTNVELNGGSYEVVNSMEDACADADVVYAKNYVALDLLPPVTQKPEQDEMVKLFGKYKSWIADEKRMNMAKPTAQYMHCLPCERGAEVSDAVLDGKWGAACFNEAENRLHAQKGVMACIIP